MTTSALNIDLSKDQYLNKSLKMHHLCKVKYFIECKVIRDEIMKFKRKQVLKSFETERLKAMEVLRGIAYKLHLLIILSCWCSHSRAFQLPINTVDGVGRLGKLFHLEHHLPSLVNEIADIVADGGMDKYNAGRDNEDKDLNITQLIAKYSCKPEEHHVRTSDGYILTLFRIPGKGQPVFLMHGILTSADAWVIAGPNSALSYLLAEQGYDVWLGNARGTKHSRKHERMSPESKEFWDFSWDEIGFYDLPASIDYVLKETGQHKLKYVGHSQGTTSFYVMCSLRPEYNAKISLMISLSPVAWMSHLISPVVRLIIVPLYSAINYALSATGVYEFAPSDTLTKTVTRGICGNTEFATLICSNVVFLLTGFSYSQLDVKNMPVIFAHEPAGCSKRQLVHYAQEVKSGKFCRYDFGEDKNLEVYSSKHPPDYPVEKVTAPVALFYSHGDWISNVTDVEILKNKIKNVVDYYEIPDKKFCHNDYTWAKDVKKLVYDRVLGLLTIFDEKK